VLHPLLFILPMNPVVYVAGTALQSALQRGHVLPD